MSLDNFKEEKVKEYLNHAALFFSLTKSMITQATYSEEEILKLLRTNYESSRIFLSEMGVEFDDKATIRMLNQQIREMEEREGANSSISFESICSLVSHKTKALRDYLEEQGLYGSVDLKLSSCLDIEIKFYSQNTRLPSKSSYRTEESYLEAIKEDSERLVRFKENFDVYDAKEDDCYYLTACESNIFKIKNLVEEFFKDTIIQFQYEVMPLYYESKVDEVSLRSIKGSILVMSSSKSLHRAFSER